MSIDIYTPRFMMRMVEQLPPLRTFLRDTFFGDTLHFPTESVIFDIQKNGMAMAPFVSPRIGNTVLEREGYETKEYTPPLVAPMRVLTTDDIDVRSPGENVINGYRPGRRQSELLQNDMIELNRAVTRREEWMVAQTLFNGEIIMIGKGVNKTINFGFENNIVVDVPWSDTKNSDPMRDLSNARKIVGRSGYSANIMIADPETLDYLLDNERLQRFFDNSGFRVGLIEPEVLGNGATYHGFLRKASLEMYSYDGEFSDNDNENPDRPGVRPSDLGFIPKVYNLVPPGKVFVGSTNMPARMLYGAIKNFKNSHSMSSRVPHSWFNDKGTMQFLEVASRPLPCPMNVSTWAILDVL